MPDRVFPAGKGLRHCQVSNGPANELSAATSSKQKIARILNPAQTAGLKYKRALCS
jgi:hypothetical protein